MLNKNYTTVYEKDFFSFVFLFSFVCMYNPFWDEYRVQL